MLLTAGVVWVAFSPALGAQESTSPPGEGANRSVLLTDIVAGWKRLAQIDDETKSCHFDFAINRPGRNSSKLSGRLGVADRVQFFSAQVSGPPKQFVYASSQWYGFLIYRADAAKPVWTVTSTYTPEELNDPKMLFAGTHPLGLQSQCFWPLSRFGMDGGGLAKWAEFYPLTIDKVESGDGELLTIFYSLKDREGTKVTERGKMVLDKSASYCPLEISRRRTLQPDVLLEERRVLATRQPLRCKSWMYSITRGMKLEEEVTMTYSNYTDQPPPAEELRLSHYGLPEPVGITLPPTRTPRYVWLLGGAGLFALLAVGLRYFTRRSGAAVENGAES